jgi:hypothetical protein
MITPKKPALQLLLLTILHIFSDVGLLLLTIEAQLLNVEAQLLNVGEKRLDAEAQLLTI